MKPTNYLSRNHLMIPVDSRIVQISKPIAAFVSIQRKKMFLNFNSTTIIARTWVLKISKLGDRSSRNVVPPVKQPRNPSTHFWSTADVLLWFVKSGQVSFRCILTSVSSRKVWTEECKAYALPFCVFLWYGCPIFHLLPPPFRIHQTISTNFYFTIIQPQLATNNVQKGRELSC